MTGMKHPLRWLFLTAAVCLAAAGILLRRGLRAEDEQKEPKP